MGILLVESNWIAASIAGAAILSVLGLAAATLTFFEAFRRQALEPMHAQPPLDLVVVARESDTITLSPTSNSARPDWAQGESWGLIWEDGYGTVGKVTAHERDAGIVTRKFKTVSGECQPGAAARIDSFAFYHDPQRAHGLQFEEVKFSSGLGTFGAWLVPADGTTWAVFVHGRNADRRESLRILPSLHAAGLNVLVIDYRNDPDCPPDPSGQHRYGLSEWEEVEAAVKHATDSGAKRVVIVGYSMGAALALQFLSRSLHTSQVIGLILDSPMLDLVATINHQITNGRLPRLLTASLSFLIHRRFGLDMSALNSLAASGEFSTPILVIHGAEDRDIPCSLSEDLAGARPDLVTFERFEGAAHVRSWNTDRHRYEAAVARFVESCQGERAN